MTDKEQRELTKKIQNMEYQINTLSIQLKEEKEKSQNWMKLYTKTRIERDNLAGLLQHNTNTTNNIGAEVVVVTDEEEEKAEDTTANVEVEVQESAANFIASDKEIENLDDESDLDEPYEDDVLHDSY